MARIEDVRLVDDLSGGEADETVPFSVDGGSWEVDLSAENAARFRAILAEYTAVARRAGITRPRRSLPVSSAEDRRNNQAVRQWARARGYKIGDRGRIPAEVLEAYHSAPVKAAS